MFAGHKWIAAVLIIAVVSITQVCALESIDMVNPSFELGAEGYISSAGQMCPGWTYQPTQAGALCGKTRCAVTSSFDTFSDCNSGAYFNGYGEITQLTNGRIRTSYSYTFKVDIGKIKNFTHTWTIVGLAMYAQDDSGVRTYLAGATYNISSVPTGGWYTATLTWAATSQQVGKRLYIKIENGGGGLQPWIDNVRLYAYPPATTTTCTINFGSTGTVINNGVRGQNPSRATGSRSTDIELCYNTLMRGVPTGGLDSDTYDWRDNNSGSCPYGPQPTTLDVLRELRDKKSWGIFTVNARGLGVAWYNNGWQWAYNYAYTQPTYRTEEVPRLGAIARQWLKYTNYMVQNYRLNTSGQVVNLSGTPVTLTGDDAAIYNAIAWEDDLGNPAPKLLAYGEPAVPKITYWEIGNEPNLNTPSGHYLPAADYSYNYRNIRWNMIDEDVRINGSQTIKTGPNLLTATVAADRAYASQILSDGGAMEFLTYHAYYPNLNNANGNISGMQNALRDLDNYLIAQEGGADDYLSATCTSLLMTEHNPGYVPESSQVQGTMAQALGIVESVFTSIGSGILAANYWNVPSSSVPQQRVWEKLQSDLGDRLVYSSVDDTNYFRLYATKSTSDNSISVWALNFSDSAERRIKLNMSNLLGSGPHTITKYELRVPGADTGLMTTSGVSWVRTDMTGSDIANTVVDFEDAVVTVITIKPYTRPAQAGLIRNDFNDDGRSDPSVVDANLTGGYTWKSLLSSGFTSTYVGDYFGGIWAPYADIPMAADWNADGLSDYGIYDPAASSIWSGTGISNVQHGSVTTNDIPLNGDWDGDGKTDVAIFRPGNVTWSWLYSGNNYSSGASVAYGLVGDIPVTGKWDTDAKTDIAVFRPTNPGYLGYKSSSSNWTNGSGWYTGKTNDIPVVGDYDGDGKCEAVIYHPAHTSTWCILWSYTNYTTYTAYEWGSSACNDLPVTGDFDGDGRADIAVYRPGYPSIWYVLKSTNNYVNDGTAYKLGVLGDKPIGYN